MVDMKADYKSAIKSAIEENNGVLTAKLEKAIKDVNARIDSAIEDMDKRMKDIEDRLSKLEDTVEALIKRIQSIAYIPIYDDEKARVNFPIQELVDLPNLLLYSILLKFAFRFCPHLSTKISGLLAFASSIICFLCSGVRIIYLITPSVGILKCMPSSRSHETTIFEIDASFEFSSYLI